MDPRNIPTDPEEMAHFAVWIKMEALQIRTTAGSGQIAQQNKMLETWAEQRPDMLARLDRAGIARDLAQVLDYKTWKTGRAYMKAGLSMAEARAQAEREWLLLEPEWQGLKN